MRTACARTHTHMCAHARTHAISLSLYMCVCVHRAHTTHVRPPQLAASCPPSHTLGAGAAWQACAGGGRNGLMRGGGGVVRSGGGGGRGGGGGGGAFSGGPPGSQQGGGGEDTKIPENLHLLPLYVLSLLKHAGLRGGTDVNPADRICARLPGPHRKSVRAHRLDDALTPRLRDA